MKTVLMIRMDKIGDLIVTLPVDRLFLDTHILWFVAEGVGFVPQNSLPPRNYVAFSKTFSWKLFWMFYSTVRTLKPDAAVVFQAPFWVGLALFLARVPKRVGVLSKFSSFFIFNKGIRQKRSQSYQHELAYNLDLIHQGLQKPGYNFASLPKLTLNAPESQILTTLGLLEFNTSQAYVVIHPGMAGSALNWTIEKYAELIQRLPTNLKIVVTGTAMDRAWTLPLFKKLKHLPHIIWAQEKLHLNDLMTVLKNAKVVLAPSTGVIHIAASLGTPVVGIYSPRTVETPVRWGPLGTSVETFVPAVSTHGQIDASVMNFIKTEDVFQALKKYF